MSAKEIKAHLKAAKQAIDKQDYPSVLTHCQAIFRTDEDHYTGLVFAGLACLKLSDYEQSRVYYRRAVRVQPDGPLAWRGFADYYDKRPPVVKEEQLEAIQAYTKLLTIIESDAEKVRSTYTKLIKLHKEFNDADQVIKCYSTLTSTYDQSTDPDAVSSCSQVWADFISYLFSREHMPEECWGVIQQGFSKISESEVKQELRVKLVRRFYARFMSSSEYDADLRMFLMEECTSLVSAHPLVALPILLHLLLMELLPVSYQELAERPVVISEQQRDWIQLLATLTQTQDTAVAAEGGPVRGSGSMAPSPQDCSLGWAGQALIGVADGKWSEARDAADKSVSCSRVPCECWLLCALLHLRHHDYKVVEKATDTGLGALSSAAKFNVSNAERSLKLCQCAAYIGRGSTKQLSQALPFLMQAHEACQGHATTTLIEAHLFLDDIPSAQSVLDGVADKESNGQLVALQGKIHLAKKDYNKALTLVSEGLKVNPTHPSLLFVRARALWEHPDGYKSEAYSALLQAAKTDPTNPEVFLYLGHYQKVVTGDLKRAEKCYQKAFSLQPSHPEAALCLGDILWTSGDQEKAYEIYRVMTADALPTRTKVAWIRMGLHQKQLGQHTEAIQSFQKILSYFPDDNHCWECLGEAYLARGSHNSALRTFNKCIQLDPDSVQCHYQIAYIKQLLGLLKESLVDYSAVLERKPDFVPALKGIGEAHLKLVQAALEQNMNGRAVNEVSFAVKNLTQAARLRPEFACVWKLLGDSCSCLHQLPPSIVKLEVPNILRSSKAGESYSEPKLEAVEKLELFEIGCRCYARALKIQPDAAYLWNDLSLAYFNLAKCMSSDSDEKQKTFEAAVSACKKAVSLSPSCYNYWNTLGVITSSAEVNNSALAQHCFIRSIQEEKNNAFAWSNLGALYLKHDNTELAYEAFKKAQSLSPDCVQAWIGHALIAERIGHAEAMDLFRHSTVLGYHPEASAGYGYWVCQTLSTISPKEILSPGGVELNEVALRGTLQARDNLQKSSSREMVDACTLNLLGLLYEHEGILTEAHWILERALECSSGETDSNVTAIKFNLARVQSALGKTPEAVRYLVGLSKEESSSAIWLELALALYRQQNSTASVEAYEQSALLCKRSDPKASTSAILTAQAMVAFSHGDRDTCKQLLFQGFQNTPVSLHCLVSLCALAYLTTDFTLLKATLQELEKVIEWQTEESHLLHPSCSEVLRTVRLLLSANTEPQSQDFVECLDKILQMLPEQIEYSMPLPTPTVLLTLLAGASPESVKSLAQKLVHAYPNSVWALALMMSQVEGEERLRSGYRSATQRIVESEVSSSGSCSSWHQSQEKSMVALRMWLTSL